MKKEVFTKNILLIVGLLILVFVIYFGKDVKVETKSEPVKTEVTTEKSKVCEASDLDCLFVGCNNFY